MIDSTDAGGDGARPHLLPGQVDPQLDQPRGRPRPLREASCRSPAASAPRSSSALIDETGDGGHRRAQGRGGAAELPHPHRGVGRARRRTSGGTRWSSPAAPATQAYVGSAAQTIEGVRRAQGRASPTPRRSSASRTSASACPPAGPRGAQLGLPLPRTQAGLDVAIVNTEKLARYADDPRGGAPPRRGAALPRAGRRAAGEAAVAAFTAHFRRPQGTPAGPAPRRAELPLDERLARGDRRGHARRGSQDDLAPALARPRATRRRSTSSTAR